MRSDVAMLCDAVRANPDDTALRAAFTDCLIENGYEIASELNLVIDSLRTESFDCEMWMYSCGEFCKTEDDLIEIGCNRCSRWAKLRKREAELWADLLCGRKS